MHISGFPDVVHEEGREMKNHPSPPTPPPTIINQGVNGFH